MPCPDRSLTVIKGSAFREVYLSLREKSIRQGGETSQSRAGARAYCIQNAQALTTLAARLGPRLTLITRYEDFALSADGRQAIADALDWPLVEDAAGELADIGRGFEVARHGIGRSVLTTMAERGLTDEESAHAHEVAALCSDYQRKFGSAG